MGRGTGELQWREQLAQEQHEVFNKKTWMWISMLTLELLGKSWSPKQETHPI